MVSVRHKRWRKHDRYVELARLLDIGRPWSVCACADVSLSVDESEFMRGREVMEERWEEADPVGEFRMRA